MCSWNGWLLEREWIPLLLLSLIMVATFGFGHVGLVPGFKLSLNRFAECPLNFPITGVHFHETRAFSTTQKYRMFAGNANGVVILIAGVIGSFGLTNDGLAKRNARSFVLPAGCVMVFLHAQSTCLKWYAEFIDKYPTRKDKDPNLVFGGDMRRMIEKYEVPDDCLKKDKDNGVTWWTIDHQKSKKWLEDKEFLLLEVAGG